ncbi:hypothetical protein [Burkholderia cepacia]|uniref:hypothetical protein n=1 Tax=Burkholderia cepacia TaxID=292 RepID=UPI000AE72ECF|nr:hypothetical protein [Burkholderia cepacia]
MKVGLRTRLAQKRRWRPRLHDIVRRAQRRYGRQLLENMMRTNALMQHLIATTGE